MVNLKFSKNDEVSTIGSLVKRASMVCGSALLALAMSSSAYAADPAFACDLVDVYFANDESSSVDNVTEFDASIQFIGDVAKELTFSATEANGALYSWASGQTHILTRTSEFPTKLPNHTTRFGSGGTALVQSLAHGYNTMTGTFSGLDKDTPPRPNVAGRTGVKQMLVIITDVIPPQLLPESANSILTANFIRSAGSGLTDPTIAIMSVGLESSGTPTEIAAARTTLSQVANTGMLLEASSYALLDPIKVAGFARTLCPKYNTNLVYTKTLAPGSDATPAEDDTITFRIVVDNQGPANAPLVTLTDNIPVGMTFVSATTAQGTYTSGTGLWDIGTINANAQAQIDITVKINIGQAGNTLTNTITLMSFPDDDASGDDLEEAVTVLRLPTITKLFTPDSIKAGNISRLKLTFGNPNAELITLRGNFVDTFPAGVVIAATPNVGGTCSAANVTAVAAATSVTYKTGAEIPINGTCTVEVDVTSSVPGTVTNTVPVGDLVTTAYKNNVPATDDLTVTVDKPDVSKSFANSTILPGGVTALTITLENNNVIPTTLTSAFTDNFPTGMTLATPTGVAGTCNNANITAVAGANSVTYNNGSSIPAGGCTVIVNVTSSTAGTVTNSIPAAALKTTFGDSPTPVNVPLTVSNNADLVTVKTLGSADATPAIGDAVSFLITVTNQGPAAATNVFLNDVLPAGITYSGNTPSGATTYNVADGKWTIGSLVNGGAATLTLTGTVTASAGSTITNITTAASTPDQTDPSTVGDDLEESVVVANDADLVTIKTLSSTDATPNEGDIVSFLITVTNNGVLDTTNVTLTDSMPAGITFTGAVTSQGTYASGIGLWTIGAIANGASATLILSGTVDAGQGGNTITNVTTAAETPDQDDPGPTPDDLDEPIVVDNDADLVTVKTLASSDATPNETDTVSFLITVTNNGGAQATNVTLTDTMPAGITLTGNNVSQGTYNATTGVWAIGAINKAANATLTLTGTVNVGQGGNTITNVTTKAETPDNNDPTDAGNDLDEPVVVNNDADLVTIKTLASSNATPGVGATVSFLITVSNKGAAQATNVTLTDNMPSGITLTGNNVSQGAYNTVTGIWAIGTINKDANATLTLTGTVNTGQDGNTITNITTAAETPDQNDPGPTPDDLEEPIVVDNKADLVTIKTLSSADATPDEGDLVSFLITVTNNGTAGTTNVSLTDKLPTGITYTTNVASQGTYDSATGLWTIGSIANAANATLVLNGTVDVGQAGKTITNITTAAETPDQDDPGPTPDDLEEPIVVNKNANLVTVKTVSAGANLPGAGETVSFLINVDNKGPAQATNVTLTDVIPAGITLTGNAVSQGAYDAATGIWTIGTLAKNANATITLTTTVNADQGGLTITNTTSKAETPDLDDPTDDGDVLTASTTVRNTADLVTVKTLSSGSASVPEGSNLGFTILVTNNGPLDTTNVSLTDLLPAGLSFISAVPSQGTYDAVTGLWAIGAVAKDASVNLVLSAKADEGQGGNTITNVATAAQTPDQVDPTTTGDDLEEAVPITKLANLVTVKTLSSSATPLNEGDTVSFQINVNNAGPSLATNVSLTDLLPAGLTLTSNTPSQGGYDATTGAWTIGSLAKDATVTLTLEGTVNAGQGGQTITNTTTKAETPDVDDPTDDGDILTASTTVTNIADLVTVKSLNGGASTVFEGGTTDFLIRVDNKGPLAATNVSLTDALPAGLSFNAANASQGTYDSATGIWTIGAIVKDAFATIVLTAAVDAGQEGNTITNVSSPAETPDQDDPTTNGDDLDEPVTVKKPNPQIGAALTTDDNRVVAPDGTFEIIYTVVVENTGDQPLEKLTLVGDLSQPDQIGSAFRGVVLPPVVSLTNTSGKSVAPSSNDIDYDGTNNLLVGDDGHLEVGDSYSVVYTVKVDNTDFNKPDVFRAQLTAAGVDPFTTLVEDETDIGTQPGQNPGGGGTPTPLTSADLELAKSVFLKNDADNSSTLTPGDTVEFTITIKNTGPDTGRGIEVTDKLTARYGYISDDGNGAYDKVTGIWVIGDLVLNAERNLVITALVQSTGNISNLAQITASTVVDPDSIPRNDDGDQSEDDEAASPPAPNLGLAVEFGLPVPLKNGDFNLPVTVIVENTSLVDIDRLDLQQDLAISFGVGKVDIVSVPVATGGIIVDTAFNGETNKGLLDVANSRLTAGSDATISYVVKITPTDGITEYLHNSNISGFSDDAINPTVVIAVSDVSNAGPEPDTNGNNNAEEQVPNRVNLKLTSAANVGLQASPAKPATGSNVGDFETTLTIDVSNKGNLPLNDVALENKLSELFPEGFEIIEPPVSSLNTLIINPNYDGKGNNNLLDSDPSDGVSSTIGVGDTGLITLKVRFKPGATTNFEHEVVLTATDEQGTPLTQNSTDDVNASGPANKTAISTDPVSALGLTQNASPAIPVINSTTPPANKVFSTTIVMNVENLGNTAINSVQVSNRIAQAFPPGTAFTIKQVDLSGALTAANPSYEGNNIDTLLSGTESLAIGEKGTIKIQVEFDLPDDSILEKFDLSATTNGVTPSGVTVTDISDNGTKADSNNDGNANGVGENDDTPILISSKPIVGLIQQIIDTDGDGQLVTLSDAGDASKPVDQRELTYKTTVSLDLSNLGNTNLDSIELIDYLTSTFPSLVSAGKISVSTPRVSNASLAINPNFDGINDPSLLDSQNSSLALGASANVQFDVFIKVNFDDAGVLAELQRQNFSNTVAVNGTDPQSGIRISDISNDATKVDLSAGADVVSQAFDGDGDYDPNEQGENVPSPILLPSAVQGVLFKDVNGDGVRDAGDTPLQGWKVVIKDVDGNVVSTIDVDDNGYYTIPSIMPGVHSAEFVTPTGVVAGVKRGLARSISVLDLNFVIDPRGVIYDSVTRQPIDNVQLFFRNVATGQRLEDACLNPNQQGQITSVTLGLAPGEYKFDVIPGQSPNCPLTATVYSIEIISDPAVYINPSVRIPGQPGVLQAGTCAVDALPTTARCEVTATDTAPAIGSPTTYFNQFELKPGDPDIINNHIPLDPLAVGDSILLTKRSHKREIEVGGFVPYTVTAENMRAVGLPGVTLSDQTPAGFKIVENSARLIRAGADAKLNTADDIVVDLVTAGQRPVLLGPIDFAVKEKLAVTYLLAVGAGASEGTYTNRITPILNNSIIGNTASADVEVVADPLFDLTTIIGKVYNDQNENGMQDEEEEDQPQELGLAGVRLATVGGELITTDQFGRYHFPGVEVGKNARGRNFILKVDPASLPEGAEFTTENPRVLRITGGLMNRIDFGVKLPANSPQFEKRQGSMIEKERAIVDLDNVFEPNSMTMNFNGKYKMGKIADLVRAQKFEEYVINVAAQSQAEGDSRIAVIKRFLAIQYDLPSALVEQIKFFVTVNGVLQSSYLEQQQTEAILDIAFATAGGLGK